jgi:ferredoxin
MSICTSKKFYKSLRGLRIAVSMTVMLLMLAAMVDYGNTLTPIGAWLARLQFLPAVMALSGFWIVFWVALTLLFGRVYCSSVCPLGASQDVVSRLARRFKSRRRRSYAFRPSSTPFIALFALLLCGGLAALVDPYAIFMRFGANIVKPAYAYVLQLVGKQGLVIATAGTITLIITVLMTVVVAACAAYRGRLYCNTVCPVGYVLGLMSSVSVFKFSINPDTCIHCGKCDRACKSSCVDNKNLAIDMRRCVVCFDCASECPTGALQFRPGRHKLKMPLMEPVKKESGVLESEVPQTGKSENSDVTSNAVKSEPQRLDRRAFLTRGVVAAVSAAALSACEGGLRGVPARFRHRGSVNPLAVTPPGTTSLQNFLTACTGCGLCISHCTNQLLRPAEMQYGWDGVMRPVADYDMSWCLYSCTRCTHVCPTGALSPLTAAEKHASPAGLSHVDRDECFSWLNGGGCGMCMEVCPVDAIERISADGSNGPLVHTDICVGCGACQNVCPAEPKAIIVKSIYAVGR